MTREPAKNPAASIRARLLALAQSKGQDYQRVLGRYAIERFLYRLGNSTYRDRFAIKGATLFTLWTGDTHRPTKDLDLLGWGSSAILEVEETIWAICKVEGNDGILFDGESVEGARIKEEDEYEGVRVRFHAVLAGARIPMPVSYTHLDVYKRQARVFSNSSRVRPCPVLSAMCSSSDSGARIVFSRSHLGFYYCRRLRFSLPVNCLGNTSERLAALLSELIEFLQQILFERCARSTQLWHKTVPTRAQLRRNGPRAHAEATAGTD